MKTGDEQSVTFLIETMNVYERDPLEKRFQESRPRRLEDKVYATNKNEGRYSDRTRRSGKTRVPRRRPRSSSGRGRSFNRCHRLWNEQYRCLGSTRSLRHGAGSPRGVYLATRAFQLPPHYGVTLLVLCSSPGGSYSNWWCSLFNADLALSVAMTACSTLLSLAMLPLNTMMYVKLAYGREVSLAWTTLALSLLNTVTAISLGLLAGHRKPKHRATFNAIGQAAGVLLMIISAVFAQKKQPIWDRDAAFYGATCLPFFLSALIATVAASLLRLRRPEQVAVVIETCYQNIAFATTVAISTFEPDEASLAAGVPVLYAPLARTPWSWLPG